MIYLLADAYHEDQSISHVGLQQVFNNIIKIPKENVFTGIDCF